jgi:hypothetical protein
MKDALLRAVFPIMNLPAVPTPGEPSGALAGVIERVIADVPVSRAHAVPDPAREAERIVKRAARQAAPLAGALALPPGPLGMLTVLPDLYLIWQTQRQMVADVYALYGRSAELTRTSMLYCLFRHAASQVLRDVAVRAGERLVVRELSAGALRHALSSVGIVVTQRLAGQAASRWVPLAGALAVGGYAYYDTLQVARTAQKLLDAPVATAA